MYDTTNYTSPIGNLLIASNEENEIIGVWMEGQKYYAQSIEEEMIQNNNIEVLKKTKEWLDRYFAGDKPDISELPLAPIGSTFRQQVWEILKEIPYGEVMTYGDIAKKIAQKTNKTTISAQAVGGAVGHNPISIIIPCHRVIGSGGNLTGYAGGISNKIKLLELEGFDTSKLQIPTKGTAL